MVVIRNLGDVGRRALQPSLSSAVSIVRPQLASRLLSSKTMPEEIPEKTSGTKEDLDRPPPASSLFSSKTGTKDLDRQALLPCLSAAVGNVRGQLRSRLSISKTGIYPVFQLAVTKSVDNLLDLKNLVSLRNISTHDRSRCIPTSSAGLPGLTSVTTKKNHFPMVHRRHISAGSIPKDQKMNVTVFAGPLPSLACPKPAVYQLKFCISDCEKAGLLVSDFLKSIGQNPENLFLQTELTIQEFKDLIQAAVVELELHGTHHAAEVVSSILASKSELASKADVALLREENEAMKEILIELKALSAITFLKRVNDVIAWWTIGKSAASFMVALCFYASIHSVAMGFSHEAVDSWAILISP